MSNSTDNGAPATEPGISEEITRAIGAVWLRHAGDRADSISTEIKGDTIACVITPATPAEDAGENEAVAAGRSVDSIGYRGDASHAISKVTHRTVVAYIPRDGEVAGTMSQKFILDSVRSRH